MNPIHRAREDRIVLDTNVVLDWLLFDDPHGLLVGQAIRSGAARWIATPAMREEHFEVIARAGLERWAPDAAAHARKWDAHCRLIESSGDTLAPVRIRCADADDQMFVDFSLSERPAWLLSRDKALLVLAPQLWLHGVRVATPSAWAAAATTAR